MAEAARAPIRANTAAPATKKGNFGAYVPIFESIILGRPTEGLDQKKLETMKGILGELRDLARAKGVEAQIDLINGDIASGRIDNRIVKLGSERQREVVREIPARELPAFLEEMHQRMLEDPAHADGIPKAMLNAWRMVGGKAGARAIGRIAMAGFAKSKTGCPEDASAAARVEYESGRLDCIPGVAEARSQPGGTPAANDLLPGGLSAAFPEQPVASPASPQERPLEADAAPAAQMVQPPYLILRKEDTKSAEMSQQEGREVPEKLRAQRERNENGNGEREAGDKDRGQAKPQRAIRPEDSGASAKEAEPREERRAETTFAAALRLSRREKEEKTDHDGWPPPKSPMRLKHPKRKPPGAALGTNGNRDGQIRTAPQYMRLTVARESGAKEKPKPGAGVQRSRTRKAKSGQARPPRDMLMKPFRRASATIKKMGERVARAVAARKKRDRRKEAKAGSGQARPRRDMLMKPFRRASATVKTTVKKMGERAAKEVAARKKERKAKPAAISPKKEEKTEKRRPAKPPAYSEKRFRKRRARRERADAGLRTGPTRPAGTRAIAERTKAGGPKTVRGRQRLRKGRPDAGILFKVRFPSFSYGLATNPDAIHADPALHARVRRLR